MLTGIAVVLAGTMLAGPALMEPAVAAPSGQNAASAPSASMKTALRLFPQYKGVKDSRSSKAPVILTGKLTTAAGKPMGGAALLLAAWPSPQQMSDLPDGATVDTMPIARTVTRPDGTYTLRAKRTAKLDQRLDDGRLDVSFEIVHGRYAYTWQSQANAAKSGRGWAPTSIDITTSRQARMRIADGY